jgi:outer membrane lipoprotein-sorting protein
MKKLLLSVLAFAVMAGLSAEEPMEIVKKCEAIMFPNAKAKISIFFQSTSGKTSSTVTYVMNTFCKDNNQKVIVRMVSPADAVGNDIIMLEKNVWLYDRNAGRTVAVPNNQAFGGTGFSYGDIVRLNISDNYTAVLKSENADSWTLGLTALERTAPYYQIDLVIKKNQYIPVKGTCYGKNGEIVKIMEYSEVKYLGGVMKPSVLKVTSPAAPGDVSIMTTLSEEIKTYPDNIFNKTNLSLHQEENY